MIKRHFNRKSIRLPDYDYSRNGAYFVTICSYKRNHIFGEINDGQLIYNEIGMIAKRCWHEIPDHFSDVVLLDSIIMPNHIHGIIVIQNDNDLKRIESNGGATCCAPTKGPKNKISEGSLGAIIRSFKGAVTKIVNSKSLSIQTPLWQRGYYEHIIRNERELQKVSDYIVLNPLNWAKDTENKL
jgi:putative transposase